MGQREKKIEAKAKDEKQEKEKSIILPFYY